jgi:hypothetical protein
MIMKDKMVKMRKEVVVVDFKALPQFAWRGRKYYIYKNANLCSQLIFFGGGDILRCQ